MLLQGTADWIEIPNCATAPWSRMVQYLRQPKKLIFLLRNHGSYELWRNVKGLNHKVFEAN